MAVLLIGAGCTESSWTLSFSQRAAVNPGEAGNILVWYSALRKPSADDGCRVTEPVPTPGRKR